MTTVSQVSAMIVMDMLTAPQWSPYLVGAAIGLLSCGAFLVSDRPIGCSTAFVKARGLIAKHLGRGDVTKKEYYREIVPAADWPFMIIPGILVGSFLAAIAGGTFAITLVPPLWASTFGNTPVLRIAAAILGGIFLAIGARWAGGCTSGHGINGSLQLSVASMISAACFFIGGIVTAFLLFRVIG